MPTRIVIPFVLFPHVDAVHIKPRELAQGLIIQSPDGASRVGEFIHILEGAKIQRVITRQPTLVDAYVRLVGPDAMKT